LVPLKKDKREIFRAAADAQEIVDMMLGSLRRSSNHSGQKPPLH
jgi:antirestriction protein ArdC